MHLEGGVRNYEGLMEQIRIFPRYPSSEVCFSLLKFEVKISELKVIPIFALDSVVHSIPYT